MQHKIRAFASAVIRMTAIMKTSIGLSMLVAIPIVLDACIYNSEAMYTPPPPGYIKYGSGKMPVKPDKFSVNPKNYPEFMAAQSFQPPPAHNCHDDGCPEMTTIKILTSDVWHVTHVFGGRYLIESKTYNDRECRFYAKAFEYGPFYVNPFGSCLRDYNFAIYIDKNGNISGGWELLPGPQLIFSARYMYMSYDPAKNAGWPSGTVFIAVKQQHMQ